MELKQKMLDEVLSKKRKIKDVADILSVSRQSVSKWLARYRDTPLNSELTTIIV